MSETIAIGIGQCGIRLATDFYSQILPQHQISYDGSFKDSESTPIDNKFAYFQIRQKKANLRLLLVDSQPGQINQFMSQKLSVLQKIENYIYSNCSANNNFAKGFYQISDDLNQNIMDAIRRTVEPCDLFEGFQMFHSIGGGTGSGLMAKIMERCTQDYPNKLRSNFVVVPSKKVSDIVTQPYNSVMSILKLKLQSDSVVLLSNDSAYQRIKKGEKCDKITYAQINKTFATAIGDCTIGSRTRKSTSLRKILVNLCPFPSNHFFGVNLGGVDCKGQFINLKKSLYQIFQYKNNLSGAKQSGYMIGSYAILRGEINQYQYQRYVQKFRKFYMRRTSYRRNICQFLKDFDSCLTTTSSIPRFNKKSSNSISLLYNSTNVASYFNETRQMCENMFRKRMFFHHYTQQGLSQEQMNEALQSIHIMSNQYTESYNVWQSYGQEQGYQSYQASFIEQQ